MPRRPAMAVRWITALVEPPSAIIVRIAFSKAPRVMTSPGRIPSRPVSTIGRPTASAMRSRRASGAGIAAEPGRAIPSASAMAAIVDAVPITVQWPSERLIPSSSSRMASSSIVPARYSAQKRRQSEHAPRLSPRKRPLRCGPPVSMMAGTFALAAPIIWAGVVLSQLPSRTTPSSGCARIISSVSMAIRLRYSMVVGRMNSSPSEIVGNSSGVPPDCQTPRLTYSASSRKLLLQLFRSLCVCAMPMMGRARSASSNPMLLAKARRTNPYMSGSWNHASDRLPASTDMHGLLAEPGVRARGSPLEDRHHVAREPLQLFQNHLLVGPDDLSDVHFFQPRVALLQLLQPLHQTLRRADHPGATANRLLQGW